MISHLELRSPGKYVDDQALKLLGKAVGKLTTLKNLNISLLSTCSTNEGENVFWNEIKNLANLELLDIEILS